MQPEQHVSVGLLGCFAILKKDLPNLCQLSCDGDFTHTNCSALHLILPNTCDATITPLVKIVAQKMTSLCINHELDGNKFRIQTAHLSQEIAKVCERCGINARAQDIARHILKNLPVFNGYPPAEGVYYGWKYTPLSSSQLTDLAAEIQDMTGSATLSAPSDNSNAGQHKSCQDPALHLLNRLEAEHAQATSRLANIEAYEASLRQSIDVLWQQIQLTKEMVRLEEYRKEQTDLTTQDYLDDIFD